MREVQEGNDNDDAVGYLDALIDHCEAIDQWLSRGGFLPAAWDSPSRTSSSQLSTAQLIATATPTPSVVSPAHAPDRPSAALGPHAVGDALDI
ncbi:hypothetical protein [Nocardia jiangxiensis]|uniref:hypothetical protein n=1 Tax=Nocardia jiangxiensis TaxID=282685 RepID=UPI00031407B9|nr:hypothetical protein [Nocardia jiangxiensis]